MGTENMEEYRKMLEELMDRMDKYENREYHDKYRDDYNYRNRYDRKNGMFSSFFNNFRNWDSHQFLIGAVLGAAATYVLGDAEIRDKIMRFGAKMYTNFAGGFEEFKEQMADLKAEMTSQDKPQDKPQDK